MSKLDKAKEDLAKMAKMHENAGKSWSKAEKWTKLVKRLTRERDEARKEVARLQQLLDNRE